MLKVNKAKISIKWVLRKKRNKEKRQFYRDFIENSWIRYDTAAPVNQATMVKYAEHKY
jgi:hypothetical protein